MFGLHEVKRGVSYNIEKSSLGDQVTEIIKLATSDCYDGADQEFKTLLRMCHEKKRVVDLTNMFHLNNIFLKNESENYTFLFNLINLVMTIRGDNQRQY